MNAVDVPVTAVDVPVTAVEVVVTAFNQGELVTAAVDSALAQSRAPREVIVVDDGSTDAASRAALQALAQRSGVRVIARTNGGVSAARNTGIAAASAELVVVLDGDDELDPSFIARTAAAVEADTDVVAASGWLRLHGAADALARPAGGYAIDFLHRNNAPATVLLRRTAWQRAGGYDEAMRSGFEDWDFFLSLLSSGGRIEIVPEELVRYRTAPASSNIRSMTTRADLYGGLIDKHQELFARHLSEALIAHEQRSIELLGRWERLMITHPEEIITEATYGDGGMAAVVRIATARAAAG